MTEATEVAILPVFEGLRTCPVCLGSGTMWVLETWMTSPLGAVVRCWHCFGTGRLYASTVQP